MRGTMVVASNRARAALVLALIAGCTQQLATLPPTVAPPSQPVSTSTPSPTAAAGIEIAWEPFVRVGDMREMVNGVRGWVILGECPGRPCETGTVWHSADLGTWETIELPRSGDILPISLSANSDGYLVAASDYDDVGEWGETFLQVWRSSDGRSWERVGELRLGACNIETCPTASGVALAPNGAIVVGAVLQNDEDYGPSYVSTDAQAWRETNLAEFLPPGRPIDGIYVEGVESTPTGLFLFGQACGDAISPCETAIWSTTDGDYWREEQDFGPADGVSFATDGIQRVAALRTCETTILDCRTDVWSGLDRKAWTKVMPASDVDHAQVTWTGDAFVLLGVRGKALSGEQRFVTYVSYDGMTWTEVPADELGGVGDCGIGWLAGGAGTVLFGIPGCAVWTGMVQPAR